MTQQGKELRFIALRTGRVLCEVGFREDGTVHHEITLRDIVARIKDDPNAVICKGDDSIHGYKYKYFIIDVDTGLLISGAKSITQAKAMMNDTDFSRQVKRLREPTAKNEWYQKKVQDFDELLECYKNVILDAINSHSDINMNRKEEEDD